MASEKQSDRDPILAAIDAKIAAWTKTRESYLAALGLESGDFPGGSLGGNAGPTDLPVGVFRDKGVKEAIVIYLQAVRQKQTNKEIAIGLKKGGIATTAENFDATVATALLRLKNEGIILRFADGWDLAASYPDSLRNRLEKDAKPTRKRGRVRASPRAAKPKSESRVQKAAPVAPKPPPARKQAASPRGGGMERRAVEYLQTRGSEFTRAEELASQLRVENLQVIRMIIGKLAKQGIVERNDVGFVRLTKKAA